MNRQILNPSQEHSRPNTQLHYYSKYYPLFPIFFNLLARFLKSFTRDIFKDIFLIFSRFSKIFPRFFGRYSAKKNEVKKKIERANKFRRNRVLNPRPLGQQTSALPLELSCPTMGALQTVNSFKKREEGGRGLVVVVKLWSLEGGNYGNAISQRISSSA